MEYLQYRVYDFIKSRVTGVLNLVINGQPSIQCFRYIYKDKGLSSFKPCYKWIAFNTSKIVKYATYATSVLNLVITGIPSIQKIRKFNLDKNNILSFKPYYNWNTFNTKSTNGGSIHRFNCVLNLIITGIPSILKR